MDSIKAKQEIKDRIHSTLSALVGKKYYEPLSFLGFHLDQIIYSVQPIHSLSLLIDFIVFLNNNSYYMRANLGQKGLKTGKE